MPSESEVGFWLDSDRELGPLPGVIRPFVDVVARIRATVHAKLLTGFLIIAMLLLGMGGFSILVITRMNSQVEELLALQRQTDSARQAIYLVTAQSHFRAMALSTGIDSWNDRIPIAKQSFTERLDEIDALGSTQRDRVERLRQIDARFAVASDQVLALYEAGETERALALHISAEHEISHELENELNAMIVDLEQRRAAQLDGFNSDRRFLTGAVASFSLAALLAALILGAILSWSLIRPVRSIDRALARLASGQFEQRVEVPNRDEFGRLTTNLNRTSEQLATLYRDLTSLNENLEKTIEEQLEQLRRTDELRRYVSPQVAEAIVAGGTPISSASTRRNLTILFCDIRGFTEMSERMEPEELVDALNQYFTAMTEIVFKHGGTLDKYVGDGMLVFFGDPVVYEDHPRRAVLTALEMRAEVDVLREGWLLRYEEELNVGIGISTGYVTVGNIGSPTRTDYTVVGNHANLASRLAGQAAGPGQILVTERTMASVRDLVDGVEVDRVHLKGVHRPIRVYEISEKVPAVGRAVEKA